MSCLIQMKQARCIDVEDVVLTVHVKDMVELLGMAEMLVVQQRLAQPVALDPEIQNVETPLSLIQQIIQGFGEGILHRHTSVLGKGIAEEADVGGRGKVGLMEIPVLPKGEIVVVEKMWPSGIRVGYDVLVVRRTGPDPHRVRAEL